MIKGALFDVDDTLYPELSYVESGFQAVGNVLAARFGLDINALSAAMNSVLQTEGRGKIFDRVLHQNGLESKIAVAELVSIYRAHSPIISLFPKVAESLQYLRRAGLKLALVTDGTLCMQKSKVASLGLESYVDAVVYCDSFGPDCWKPHPLPFRRAAELLQIQPESCAFIGNDPAKDFPAPLALGMLTVHLQWTNRSADCCNARFHTSSMDGVLTALGVQ